MIADSKILITGGAGFIGVKLIDRYYAKNEIVVYSRDEGKHYYLKKRFPDVRFIIGDVADRDRLVSAGEGCQYGIFAASLKQIESVDQNFEVANSTIVVGSFNSRFCAESNNMESACFISSDKSRSATTLYGSMKFTAGESFIVNSEDSHVRLSTVIYGNVLNSTGSIIPVIWDALSSDYSLSLYHPEMTRFMITACAAVDTIEYSLKYGDGVNVIPVLVSFSVRDLFDLYCDEFNLQYTIGVPRISEKIHEILISEEEGQRAIRQDNHLLMHYRNISGNPSIGERSSRDHQIPKEELRKFLEEKEWYR